MHTFADINNNISAVAIRCVFTRARPLYDVKETSFLSVFEVVEHEKLGFRAMFCGSVPR